MVMKSFSTTSGRVGLRSPGPGHGSFGGGVWALAVLGLAAASASGLDWQPSGGHRVAPLAVSGRERAGFERLEARALGVVFTNTVARERSLVNRNLLNGSGVAAGDVDGDGRCDVYFCGLDADNALFRNLGGWRFADVTRGSGVECAGQDSTGAVFADVDGDRDLDLLVTALDRGTRLFLNDGHGRFREATGESGLLPTPGGTTMALADVDGDGDLDLYVAHYRPDTIADRPSTTYRIQVIGGWPEVVQVNGQPVTLAAWTNRFEVSPLGRVLERGLPDQLYRNDGKGRFVPVPFTAGAFLGEDGQPLKEPPRDWGLSAQFHDLNGDGAPDLYVCNDFVSPDRFWLNDGSGRFRALPRSALRTTSASSMGVDAADVDRDGDVDLLVVDMLSPDHRKRHVQLGERASRRPAPGLDFDRLQVSRNTLLLSRGDGTFSEAALFAGLEASDWSWQPTFLDVDLDGYEDVLVANGVLRDFQNVDAANRMEAFRAGRNLSQKEIHDWIGRFPSLETPNLAFRNRRDGTFEDASAAWGFDTPTISQGMALADLDDDGDLDVVLNNFGGAPGFHRNAAAGARVAVRLKGGRGNPEGIGARIVVRGGPVGQAQEMIGGGRYLSGDQAQRVLAAGSARNRLHVEVTWRGGRRSVLEVAANTLCEIDEAAASVVEPQPVPAPPPPMFADVPSVPDAGHVEQAHDEAGRQPLLSRALDRLGPGLAWHDLDRDGWDDLIVGNGRGGAPVVLLNQAGKGFLKVTNAPFHRPVARDQTSVIGVRDSFLAGSSNFEDGAAHGGLIRVHDFQRRVAGDSLPGFGCAVGPRARADIDADGDLDLFAGGRAVAGRYPEPADSVLFRNDGGRFVVAQRLEALGRVSGAVFSDLDSDGTPELVLATDWGSLRVFRRENGEYREMTEAWGLASATGWWAGVTTGDFDGDGRLEIVASNWGLNSAWRASVSRPLRLYHGDLDDNGTFDLVEARFHPGLAKLVPEQTLDVMRTALPFLQMRVPDFAMYGGSSLEEIYGEALENARFVEVNTLASTLFRWRGSSFEAVPLPAEAQLAPAQGVAVGDLDGDGAEDLFCAQNFSAITAGDDPLDNGRGLVLLGDGRGGWTPLPPGRSGVRIEGDQRGCALGDFDGDGRVDLAVGRNGGTVRILRNAGARPGLRIRLEGTPGNPDGAGAQIRLESGGVPGPLREIQAGGGYWSQNSAVQVMSLPHDKVPDAIQVLWPGGRRVKAALPLGAREVRIGWDGTIRAEPVR